MQRSLADNAAEFVNSNRGTYAKDEKVFRASSLYDRNLRLGMRVPDSNQLLP